MRTVRYAFLPQRMWGEITPLSTLSAAPSDRDSRVYSQPGLSLFPVVPLHFTLTSRHQREPHFLLYHKGH